MNEQEAMPAQSLARVQTRFLSIGAAAGIETPPIGLVPILGKPLQGWSGVLGNEGIAITKWQRRKNISVSVAASAARDLTDAALDHVLAHELGHVIHYRHARAHIASWAWTGLFAGVAGTLLWALLLSSTRALEGMATAWTIASPFIAVASVFAALGCKLWFQRREELRADRYAIVLLQSIDGVREVADYEHEHMTADPTNRADALKGRKFRPYDRLLATHPPRSLRIRRMEQQVIGIPNMP